MKWFRHKSTANMDAKLQEVMLDHGLEGYGLYWYCIELIASEVESENLTFELEHDARVIARNTGSTVDTVERIMSKFIELGLFEAECGVITCLKLSKVADDYTSKFIRKNPQAIDNKRVLQSPTKSDKNNTEEIILDKNRLDNNKLVKANKPARSPSIDYEAVKTCWNRVMVNSPKVSKLNEKRKRLVKKLFQENDLTVEKFANYLGYVSTTDSWKWCFETTHNQSNGIKYGPRPFEYFLKDDVFLRAKEEI